MFFFILHELRILSIFYCSVSVCKPIKEWYSIVLLSIVLYAGDEGEITTTDLLLGIWSEDESPGHKILAALGFDDEKAKKLKSLGS